MGEKIIKGLIGGAIIGAVIGVIVMATVGWFIYIPLVAGVLGGIVGVLGCILYEGEAFPALGAIFTGGIVFGFFSFKLAEYGIIIVILHTATD